MVSRTEKHTDVVIVGFGWVGAIMARELTQAGLNVVALERGPRRDTWPEGAYPSSIDELTHNTRHALFLQPSKSTVTVRHKEGDVAAPLVSLLRFFRARVLGVPGCTGQGATGAFHRLNCVYAVITRNDMERALFHRI